MSNQKIWCILDIKNITEKCKEQKYKVKHSQQTVGTESMNARKQKKILTCFLK